jgi:hypothetical protein
MVESYPQNKKSNVKIKPYFNPQVDNMGLQKYGLSLFDGAFHEEPIACLEINGIKRYLTGLNEFAPEIKSLSLEDQEAKVKEIRRVVSHLEKTLAGNVIDPEDKEFWNKVKLLKQDNGEFWFVSQYERDNANLYFTKYDLDGNVLSSGLRSNSISVGSYPSEPYFINNVQTKILKKGFKSIIKGE